MLRDKRVNFSMYRYSEIQLRNHQGGSWGLVYNKLSCMVVIGTAIKIFHTRVVFCIIGCCIVCTWSIMPEHFERRPFIGWLVLWLSLETLIFVSSFEVVKESIYSCILVFDFKNVYESLMWACYGCLKRYFGFRGVVYVVFYMLPWLVSTRCPQKHISNVGV